jgi:biopolymer transport protein ExbB
MAPNTAQVDNPFSLMHMLETGDWVSKTIFSVLLIMSLVSWYIILIKLWDQRRMFKHYKEVEKGFWTAGSLRDGLNKLTGKDNGFRLVAEDGMRAAQHHEGRLTDQIPLHDWITVSLNRSVDSVAARLRGGLSFLATVGSSAPFVGLLGTVWGIYNALVAISLAGQAAIDKTAGPIGEALIMTAVGLFAAVPAVWGYNWLLNRNKAIVEKLRYFAADLHSYLVSGARVDSGQASATPPRPAASGAAAAVRK